MGDCITIRKTYKYRLYQHHHLQRLDHMINVAGLIWNHALALQKRYYRLTGQYIKPGDLKTHIAFLRMHTHRFGFWKTLGSQAVQDVLERLDDAYQRFFKCKAKRPPKFKKVKSYTSFTLKQSGWHLLPDKKAPVPKGKGFKRGVGVVEISNKRYKYVKHRPLNGVVKTITIKRDTCHRFWICFSVIEQMEEPKEPKTGQAAGFDFGLKTFLTDDAGNKYMNPLFFKAQLKRIKTLNRAVSRKQKGSHNQDRARYLLNRTHLRIADKRRDFHYQLAHALCKQFDVMVFEDLNIDGMKRRWGRKVSDLGFAQFMEILQEVAFKQGKQVVFIPRFERTTGKCSNPQCQYEQAIGLHERTWHCEHCGLTLDRDHNAALNILHVGASTYTGLGIVSPQGYPMGRPLSSGSPADPRSPSLFHRTPFG